MFIRSFWKSILWAVFILILSSIPGKSLDRANIFELLYIDKFAHAFLYFILTILLISGFRALFSTRHLWFSYIFPLIISVFYGLLMELFQLYVFYDRGAELLDIIANLAGALIATGFCALFFFKQE
jgi:VanZ family protein